MFFAAFMVAIWYYAFQPIKMDSPFGGVTFGGYLMFASAGVFLLGLPYAILAIFLLRRLKHEALPELLALALLPSLLLLAANGPTHGLGRFLAPGTAIAAIIMALAWWALASGRYLKFRREAAQ